MRCVGLDLGGAMGEDDESPMYGILKDKVKKKTALVKIDSIF